jgi:hypothetical protein
MNESRLKETNSKPAETAKFYETQLKLAYACFLRLNCDVGELRKSSSWRYKKQDGAKDVVNALSVAYINVFKENAGSSLEHLSDWSGESQLTATLEAAVGKCKELYPTLSRNYSFSRQRVQHKTKSLDSSIGSKRKHSPQHEKRAFEVTVPEGLKEGDSFLTSVMVGETMKRVRLTVPSESASSLLFSLQVPVSEPKPRLSIKIKIQTEASSQDKSV